VKRSDTHDPQLQTLRVSTSYLHNSLGMISWPLVSAFSTRSGPNIIFSLGSIQLSGVRHRCPYSTLMVPSSDSLGSCCCTRTLPTANYCPNSLDIPSHKPVTYPRGFGSLAQFGYPSMDDRSNYGSNESRGTRAVAPKSDRQTTTLDQR
jgi:hypothetical protein